MKSAIFSLTPVAVVARYDVTVSNKLHSKPKRHPSENNNVGTGAAAVRNGPVGLAYTVVLVELNRPPKKLFKEKKQRMFPQGENIWS